MSGRRGFPVWISVLPLAAGLLLFPASPSPALVREGFSTPTPVPAGAFFRLTEVESLRVTHPRGTARYNLAYQLRDTAGEITSRGHIFDTENRVYPKQSGDGAILLRSFVHKGFATQPGDDLLVTYDAGRQKRIYLPALTGYSELYVASDGSTYYDGGLSLLAQEALPGTPTPTLTPEGFHTTTPTPYGYRTMTPPPSATPTPFYCYSCPQLLNSSIALSTQTSSQEVIYDFTFNCLRETNLIHNWWTSATDWLIVDPPQGFGFDSQIFAVTVSLGDTSSLAPGEYDERIVFDHDWGCNEVTLSVNYRHPPPEFFRLTDLENLRVTHPRSDGPYNLVYRLRNTSRAIVWGHIYDRANRFYDGSSGPGDVTVEAFAHSGYSPQPGDDLRLTHDGGRDFHIYLPAFTGYTELYVADSGATYYDPALTQLAQAALAPTPSTTPTPVCYRTPSPSPSPSPTNGGTPFPTPIPGAPSVEPNSIVLTDQQPSRTVTYHMLWSNAGKPGVLNYWWAIVPEWLVADPHQGFGFDPQDFSVTVSLGDTSSLGPGLHSARIYFYGDWHWDLDTWLTVIYSIPTPTPTPPFLVLDSGDFDGDGTAEIAVFRPATSLWALRGLSRFYFGRAGDIPVSGDYAGEGTAAAAIYRPSTSLWAVRGLTRVYTGCFANSLVPVPGDYDGDGACNVAIFYEGFWVIRGLSRFWFGYPGSDLPVPGDYNGNGVDEIAFFRPSSGLWAVRGFTRYYFGGPGDRPVPGDYLGAGFLVPAVFRPSTGLWAVRGWTRAYFGRGNDFPVPADFTGAGYDDPAVFRPATGLWAVRGLTRAYFGAASDLPATR